jgi:hypothetical protein
VISPSQKPLPTRTHKTKPTGSTPSAGFEPTIPTIEKPQTYALDRMATGIDHAYPSDPKSVFGFETIDRILIKFGINNIQMFNAPN